MRKLASVATLLAVGSVASAASASNPMGAWARVEKVEYEPDATTATKARVYGVFALWDGTAGGAWSYTAPQAGYMYFVCPVGKEANCRMEWAELAANASSAMNCIGFGQLNTAPGRVRPLSETPTAPDTYPIAMGTASTSYAGGTCEKLRTYTAPTDAGVVDSGTTKDSGTPVTDTGSVPTDTGTPIPSTPAPTPAAGEKDGCSVSAAGGGSSGLGLVVLGLAFASLRARRRSS